jgi:hypothetical protein
MNHDVLQLWTLESKLESIQPSSELAFMKKARVFIRVAIILALNYSEGQNRSICSLVDESRDVGKVYVCNNCMRDLEGLVHFRENVNVQNPPA